MTLTCFFVRIILIYRKNDTLTHKAIGFARVALFTVILLIVFFAYGILNQLGVNSINSSLSSNPPTPSATSSNASNNPVTVQFPAHIQNKLEDAKQLIEDAAFVRKVSQAHPDAPQLLPELEKWVNTQPESIKNRYNSILNEGSADDVIGLYNIFKQSTARSKTSVGINEIPTGAGIRGRVIQTMNSGGYTYALILNERGDQDWLALPLIQIAVGDKIEYPETPPLMNFQSKTLNKTFEKISFVPGIRIQ